MDVVDEPFLTDLRLDFLGGERADLLLGAGVPETIGGIENLVQALRLRLLIDRGELAALGHPMYGSRVRELLGETLDRANLELLRRYVRKTMLHDPRVAEVASVVVTPRQGERDAVHILATVLPVEGAPITFETVLHGG
jgi:hypothetical protein